jgi:hypothetical protein
MMGRHCPRSALQGALKFVCTLKFKLRYCVFCGDWPSVLQMAVMQYEIYAQQIVKNCSKKTFVFAALLQ